jgi:hypothetical protein
LSDVPVEEVVINYEKVAPAPSKRKKLQLAQADNQS